MASLHVSDVPDDIVAQLQERAARNNRSAEDEHRQLLLDVLRRLPRRGLADIMLDGPFREPDFRAERDPGLARDSGL